MLQTKKLELLATPAIAPDSRPYLDNPVQLCMWRAFSMQRGIINLLNPKHTDRIWMDGWMEIYRFIIFSSCLPLPSLHSWPCISSKEAAAQLHPSSGAMSTNSYFKQVMCMVCKVPSLHIPRGKCKCETKSCFKQVMWMVCMIVTLHVLSYMCLGVHMGIHVTWSCLT